MMKMKVKTVVRRVAARNLLLEGGPWSSRGAGPEGGEMGVDLWHGRKQRPIPSAPRLELLLCARIIPPHMTNAVVINRRAERKEIVRFSHRALHKRLRLRWRRYVGQGRSVTPQNGDLMSRQCPRSRCLNLDSRNLLRRWWRNKFGAGDGKQLIDVRLGLRLRVLREQ